VIIDYKIGGQTCTTNEAFEEVKTKNDCYIAYTLLDAQLGGYNAGAGYYQPNKMNSKCGLVGKEWYFTTGYLNKKKPICGSKQIVHVDRGAVEEPVDCICLIPECSPCPENTYSEGGLNSKCKPCKTPRLTNAKRTKCLDVAALLDKQKEKHNDLSIRNSRLWQKEEIRMKHDDIMQQRKEGTKRLRR
jgi:hypothetical protein